MMNHTAQQVKNSMKRVGNRAQTYVHHF